MSGYSKEGRPEERGSAGGHPRIAHAEDAGRPPKEQNIPRRESFLHWQMKKLEKISAKAKNLVLFRAPISMG
jgi:hypothetical protein